MKATPVLPRFAHALLRVGLSREAYARAAGDLVDLAERVADVRGRRAARRACVREAGFILLWSAADGARRAVERLAHKAVPVSPDSPTIGEGATPSLHMTRRRPMGDLGRDLRYGARALRRSPGFAAVALLTLALGIGATTALFSVVDRVLIHPAPWPEADRVALIGWQWGGGGEPTWGLSPAKADYWKRHGRSFEAFALVDETHFVLTGEGEPEPLTGELVSDGYFRVIGIAPAIGRAFTPEEDVPGGPPVVILSDGRWRRSFGADPNVVGRTITLDGDSHTVIGVMPPAYERGASEYHLAAGVDVLAPLRLEVGPSARLSEQGHNYLSFGRLAAGVTPDQLEAEVGEFTRQFDRAYPGVIEEGQVFRVQIYTDYIVGDTLRTTVWLSFGAVGLLLVIACANVASLLLARADVRRQELALRAALGAGRGRLIGQLVAESILLGLMGGALGVVLARWGLDLILALAPENVSGLSHVGLSLPVLGFALAVSVFTGIAVGLAGAVHALRPDLAATLREAGRIATLGQGGRNVRSLLIMTEAAVSVVLLIGAGLLLASLLRLRAVDLGFEPEGVYTVELRLPPERYATTDATWRFESLVIERLRALPGVTATGSASNLPLVRGLNTWVNVVSPGERRGDIIEYRAVSPDFLDIVGTEVIEGRGFSDADHGGAPAVALVNEAFVRRFFANDDPLGATIGLERTVVGVVRDVKDFGPRQAARATAYAPRSQLSDGATRMMNRAFAPAFVLGGSNPTALAAGIRRAVQEVDPSQPILRMRPLSEIVAGSMADDRFFLRLLGTFAGLALVLTAVGVYGVVSYAVGQRTHEIGLRMALGAGRRGVVGLVVRQGMVSVAVGLGAGLVAAYALSRLLSDLLFEVSVTDPTTFVGVTLMLAVVAVLACYVPARRASRVDPMIALRAE